MACLTGVSINHTPLKRAWQALQSAACIPLLGLASLCNGQVVTDINATLEAIPPGLNRLKPFPDYRVKAHIDRDLHASLDVAALRLLDYSNQCMDCRYFVNDVLTQEVFRTSGKPHQFVVWQDVSKEFNILAKKLQVQSSSFTEVNLYRTQDTRIVVIDSHSVDEQRAATLAGHYQRVNNPAFSVLHARWMLTRLNPDQHHGKRVSIVGVAGGKPAGAAAMAPKSFLRKDLEKVMEQTLDFIE